MTVGAVVMALPAAFTTMVVSAASCAVVRPAQYEPAGQAEGEVAPLAIE